MYIYIYVLCIHIIYNYIYILSLYITHEKPTFCRYLEGLGMANKSTIHLPDQVIGKGNDSVEIVAGWGDISSPKICQDVYCDVKIYITYMQLIPSSYY